jgi:hypothetical protein
MAPLHQLRAMPWLVIRKPESGPAMTVAVHACMHGR